MARPDTGAAADRDGIGTDPPRSRSQVWAALARFAAFSVVALLAVLAGTVVVAERATRDQGRDADPHGHQQGLPRVGAAEQRPQLSG